MNLRIKSAIATLAIVALGITPAIPATGTARYSDDGPEAQLARVFQSIDSNRIDIAQRQIDDLTRAYPNFRLAQLVKGDLLLARTRQINRFGNIGNVSSDKLSDLREEAIARLHALRNKPQGNLIPRYLLQMPSDQKYAIVIDTKKSRLYLYQNDRGTPRPACRARKSAISTARVRFPSATPTNGTSSMAAMATASGCMARLLTPTPAHPRPLTAVSFCPTRT